MKSFLRTVLAILFVNALIVGVLVLVLVAATKDDTKVESGSVLIQAIAGPISEYAPPTSGVPLLSEEVETHTTILENLEKARHDERIEAVVLRLDYPVLGFAMMDELRDRISQLRDAGKPVWGYTSYLNHRSLYLGAACDSLFLFPGGYVSLYGVLSERPYIKGTLDKLGVKPQLHRIENYKSAAEIITRSDMSDETRENTDWILDEYFPNWLSTIEADRGLTTCSLEDCILEKAAMVPADALEAELVDRLAYFDQIESSLLNIDGIEEAESDSDYTGPRPRMIHGGEYAKISREKAGIKGKKTIAVVHAQGTIEGEKSGFSPLWGMTMGAGTMEKAFRQAVENEDVEGIIFRVNSGGGESSASWRIGRAVERADEAKPMVVSMCNGAASGGYHIAHPCSTLIAERHSIVGSIGSISGKFNFREFYNKLGITKDFVTRGPHAMMWSDYDDFSPEQYAAFSERHWMDYWEWVDQIAHDRNMTRAEVDSVGRGRVFTGTQALERGLIDHVGGFDLAVQLVKEKAGIPEDEEVEFVHYPKKQGPLEALKSGSFTAFFVSIINQIVAPLEREQTWAVDWNQYW